MRKNIVLNKSFPINVIHHQPLTYSEQLHWHSCLEVGLCLSGKGMFFFGNKAYDVRAGDVFITNNVERHIAKSDEHHPSEYVFIYFDVALIDNRELLLPFFSNPRTLTNRIPFESESAKKMGELILAIVQEDRIRGIAYKDMIRSFLNLLCGSIYRYYYASLSYDPKMDYQYAAKVKERLAPALHHIKENYGNPISLEDIANLLYLSPSRTYHLFFEVIGESFKSYLTELRINEAKRLLVETEKTITEVSIDCGFQSHSSFYRAFDKIVGMNPKQYQTKARTIDKGEEDLEDS